MVHTRKPCPGCSGDVYLIKKGLSNVLSQSFNSVLMDLSVKYHSAAVHHNLLPTGSTVSGTL